MKKWEYKILVRHLDDGIDVFESELNELGKEGWEIVSVPVEHTYYTAFLKREVKEDKEYTISLK